MQKFRELWARGLSAHLDLECGGGEAWVGLRIHLGRHRAGGAQQEVRGDRHIRGASYARRLARYAANRTTAEQAGSAPVHAEQAMDVPAHDVGEGDVEVRVEGGVEATEEVVEAGSDAAVSTLEVEEPDPASAATADEDEACDTTGTDSDSDDDDSEDGAGTSGPRCSDCGFRWDLLKPEDHEYCEWNLWHCGHCGGEARTIREVNRHMKCGTNK